MNESDVDAAMRDIEESRQALANHYRADRRARLKANYKRATEPTETPVTDEMVARLEAERVELEDFARRRQLAHQSACDDYEDMLAAKDARIAALEADNVTLAEELGAAHKVIAWLERKLAAFTDDPPDLPDPPRRPDGTLMPQPKALTLPRETGDKRRVGS